MKKDRSSTITIIPQVPSAANNQELMINKNSPGEDGNSTFLNPKLLNSGDSSLIKRLVLSARITWWNQEVIIPSTRMDSQWGKGREWKGVVHRKCSWKCSWREHSRIEYWLCSYKFRLSTFGEVQVGKESSPWNSYIILGFGVCMALVGWVKQLNIWILKEMLEVGTSIMYGQKNKSWELVPRKQLFPCSCLSC